MGLDLSLELGIMKVRATYQNLCHLERRQRVRAVPRKWLASVPALGLIELKEVEIGFASARLRSAAVSSGESLDEACSNANSCQRGVGYGHESDRGLG
jgi:hypothetical protein